MNAALRDGAELEESKSIPTDILIFMGYIMSSYYFVQTKTRKRVKLRALKKMQVRTVMLRKTTQTRDLYS